MREKHLPFANDAVADAKRQIFVDRTALPCPILGRALRTRGCRLGVTDRGSLHARAAQRRFKGPLTASMRFAHPMT